MRKRKGMNEDFLSRLREFLENGVRSGSMDLGCITPLYVYRMCGGAIPMEDIENGLIELWRENEPNETFPQPRLDRWSTSVATRDSRSKLHSLLAAPSVPLYGKDAIDYEGTLFVKVLASFQ